MAIIVFPLDPVAGAPAYSAGNLRQTLSALAGTAPTGRPLGASSGVRPGTPSTTVTATSSVWTVNPHSGILDVESSATTGPYFYAVSSAATGSMTTADGSNDRIDLISIQVSDTSTGDGTGAATGQIVYTVGTAAATPVAPSTPARAYVLASVYVPKSGTGSPAVTWAATPWGDTGWVTTGVTPASGVTITTQRSRRVGNRAWVYVAGTFGSTAAAAIMTSTSKLGDYGNVTVATVSSAITPAFSTGLTTGTTGAPFAFVINTAGAVQITGGPAVTTAYPGTSPQIGAVIGSTTNWNFSGTYLLD